MFELSSIAPEQAPRKLLLEADPSIEKIERYLASSECFAVSEGQEIVGVCVALKVKDGVFEIMNIATDPERQAQGIGSKLLTYALEKLKQRDATRVELTTGAFGHQLSFYQRHGFRVTEVLSGFFLSNYDEPLFENGIQHQDALRLVCELNQE